MEKPKQAIPPLICDHQSTKAFHWLVKKFDVHLTGNVAKHLIQLVMAAYPRTKIALQNVVNIM